MRGPQTGSRRTSKYLGKRYEEWTVLEQERYNPLGINSHAMYNYYLSKIDLSTKKLYTVYVSASTLRRLDKGQTTMKTLLSNKQWLAETMHIHISRNKILKTPLTSTLYN